MHQLLHMLLMCVQMFSSVNLVLTVPYKAIVDVRMHWHALAVKNPNSKLKGPPHASL
jgi:hypothetical protein